MMSPLLSVLAAYQQHVYDRHMRRMDLFITNNQDDELRRLAKATDMTRSEHLRRAIDEYLRKWKQGLAKPAKPQSR